MSGEYTDPGIAPLVGSGLIPERWAQVTYASFRNPDSADDRSGGWRVGPELGATPVEAGWVASNAPTQLEPITPFDDFISQEEIDQLPRRFEYVPARFGPQGQAVYMQSVPAGKDSTGRPGNVFTHAFIDRDPAGPPPTAYPIDAFNGPAFATPFRKTGVNSVQLAPLARPADAQAGPYSVAWLVVSQLLGDRTGAMYALQHAVEDPNNVAVLLVQNQQDATYWLQALAATMSAQVARDMLRLSTFERAHTLDSARLAKQHVALVCVPAVDKHNLPLDAALTIIDPSDPDTWATPRSAWSRLTANLHATMHNPAIDDLVATLRYYRPELRPLAGDPASYAAGLAAAVYYYEGDTELPNTALTTARQILTNQGIRISPRVKHTTPTTNPNEETHEILTTLPTLDLIGAVGAWQRHQPLRNNDTFLTHCIHLLNTTMEEELSALAAGTLLPGSAEADAATTLHNHLTTTHRANDPTLQTFNTWRTQRRLLSVIGTHRSIYDIIRSLRGSDRIPITNWANTLMPEIAASRAFRDAMLRLKFTIVAFGQEYRLFAPWTASGLIPRIPPSGIADRAELDDEMSVPAALDRLVMLSLYAQAPLGEMENSRPAHAADDLAALYKEHIAQDLAMATEDEQVLVNVGRRLAGWFEQGQQYADRVQKNTQYPAESDFAKGVVARVVTFVAADRSIPAALRAQLPVRRVDDAGWSGWEGVSV